MIEWFQSGGVIMWPLLVLALGVIGTTARAALALHRFPSDRSAGPPADPESSGRPAGRRGTPGAPGAPPSPDHRSLTLVLFWGGVALLVGALGTVVGIAIMARGVAAAGSVTSSLAWGGVAVALVSVIFGTLIFLLSGVLWLALDGWRRRLVTRLSTALIALASLGFLAGCGADGESAFVVADSAGISIAENPGDDHVLPATPVRLAYLQPPDSALMAVPWGVTADPASGRIYVADARTPRVAVFDASGAFLQTLGGEGGGPGEFRSVNAVAMDPDGALAAWDARRGIISRWSTEGELLDEERAPVSFWGPGFVVRPRHVLTVTASTAGDERRQALVRAAAGGGNGGDDVGDDGGDDVGGDPMELFVLSRTLVPLELPGMNMPAPRIFAPDLIWTAAGDTVYVLNGPEYRIDALVDDRTVASVRRAIAPIQVTAEMAAARVSAGPFRGFMRRAGLTADQIVAAVGFEETTSPVHWLAADPTGRLWVSRGSGGATPDEVDLFAREGRYLGTFPAPGMPVAFLSDSTFVALEVTDLGEPRVALYRMAATDPGEG